MGEYFRKSLVACVTHVTRIHLEEALKNFKILSRICRYDYEESDWSSRFQLVSEDEK